jgi:hypothetical protein
MLGQCFKLCSSTASGKAQALPLAMLKQQKAYRVRMVRATYSKYEQIMRGLTQDAFLTTANEGRSHVSCLMFRITVSSRFIVSSSGWCTPRERSRGSQSAQSCEPAESDAASGMNDI